MKRNRVERNDAIRSDAGENPVEKKLYFESQKKEETRKKESYIADWQVGYAENQPDIKKPVSSIGINFLW